MNKIFYGYKSVGKVNKDGVVKKKVGKKIYKYEFADEIWNIIKDYAGIYNIDINWNIPLAKLSRGIKTVCRFGITNVNCANFSLDKRIKTLKKGFWKYLNNKKFNRIGNKKEILEKLNVEFNPPKKEKELWCPPEYLKIGDELLYNKYNNYRGHKMVGVIQKINKNSIVLRDYKYYKIEDYAACRQQTFGTDYLVLLKNKPLDDKNIIIKSDKFYDKTTCDEYMLKYFEKIEISVDWGG